LTKSSSVIGFLIKYRVESDRAFRKAMELAKLISKGGTGVEVSMLYVVHELVAPNRIFDHDLDIKSKITGERLTAKQYMKEVYQVMKLGAKTMLDKKKSQEIEDPNINIRTLVTQAILLIKYCSLQKSIMLI
jgi:hypothetical protein